MAHITKEQLDCIAVALAKNDKNLYTKTDVNRAIVTALSERVGWDCSHGYIANLRNGVQLDKTSVMLKAKIDQLHTMLRKSRKPRPERNPRIELGGCSKERAADIRDKFTPLDRTKIFERAMRESR